MINEDTVKKGYIKYPCCHETCILERDAKKIHTLNTAMKRSDVMGVCQEHHLSKQNWEKKTRNSYTWKKSTQDSKMQREMSGGRKMINKPSRGAGKLGRGKKGDKPQETSSVWVR